MDRLERELRTYYEAEASGRLRPPLGDARRRAGERFARRLAQAGCDSVVDVGAGPGTDHRPFAGRGIRYVGADLAVGNAQLAAEVGEIVVPASLFELPFADRSFAAGWSMSTFQHVGDDRIDEALTEFVRVLRPGAPIAIGLWGGHDEIIDASMSSTGIAAPRRFVLRSGARISSLFERHLGVDAHDVSHTVSSEWEYHLVWARVPG